VGLPVWNLHEAQESVKIGSMHITRLSISTTSFLLAGLLLASCASPQSGKEQDISQSQTARKAQAVLQAAKGSQVSGIVTFTETDAGTLVHAELTGLTPGEHGFHIHEFGGVLCDDGKCTGGHFNPAGSQHGAPLGNDRHMGDLGNIVANTGATAIYDVLDTSLDLDAIIGRSIVVHADADDLKTQPTGNAGNRIAYGTIGIAKGE